jgi:hypothetical protein
MFRGDIYRLHRAMNSGYSTQPKINPWLIAIAVILPTFIEVLDTTVVSVALQNIAGNLSATISQATWIQTGYLISNAVILPAAAWFSALFGRKRFLMACVGIFTVASFACGAAPNLSFLIFASDCARRGRRRVAAHFAGDFDGEFSARQARRGHGGLRGGRGRGARGGTGGGRLAHRQLFLALDLLHQHPLRPGRPVDDQTIRL